MNFNRLRYFVAVADERHFGRAARRLHMAQPPLSQQIRQFEHELGVELFDRSTRPIRLTAAGRMLYPDAQRIVTSTAALSRKMEQVTSGGVGVLRLGFVGSASYSVLPTFVQAYQDQWPAVECDFSGLSSDEQSAALIRGDIDFGIGRVASRDSAITSTTFMTERLCLAVNSNHRLANHASIHIADLAGEQLVGFDRAVSPSLHQELHRLFTMQGGNYDPVVEASAYTTIVGLVASRRGVAVVPASVRAIQPSNLTYVELADRQAVSSFMFLRRIDDSSPLVEQATQLMTTFAWPVSARP